MRVVCVAGARPNFMKVAPVMLALEARGAEVVLVHTGQHYDESMSQVFLTELGIRPPDHYLGVGSGTHAEQVGRVMVAFEPLVAELAPDVVVVVGDVNSTVACALVAAKAGPLVAHVEAGLRSRDWSMPEEVNRVVTDRVSDFLLAPSPDAMENLLAEGYRDDQLHLVGNVMVDSVVANLDRARARPVLADLGLCPGQYGVVTLHRPSNVDDASVLGGLLSALSAIAEECPLVFPVHPRTKSRLVGHRLADSIHLVDPVGYLDFLALEADARMVVTDSGGVQEETTVLGVPCLTVRESTERPITVSHGTNTVVGTGPRRIVAEARRILRERDEPRCPPLWDGRAGPRVASVLLAEPPAGGRLRPTER